jgi:acyl-CoA synthetase (NDP forming)
MTSTAPEVGELSEPPVLDALLRPRSVAMIGASRDPKALGGRPLGFMARYGFAGKVYPVNGSAPEVQGLRSYASITDVPGPVDLALVMVRAELVPGVLRDCAAAGVRVAVILSSGFGEGTGAGEGTLESVGPELAAAGMRILGPNCEGLASLPADAPLTFSPVLDVDASGTRLRPGNIAVLSQSGGLGFAVAQWGTEAGLDFSYIISTGNEYDLDCLELAGLLVELPDADIVIMLVEAFHDLAEFARVGERFRQAGKRLVVTKLGKSEPGARGAYAHTRHVAGDLAEYTSLCRAHGVLEADSEEELIDVVQAIAKSRKLGTRELPAGARIGIATTSGGAGVWLADACAARGLAVPVLSPLVQELLKAHMPPFGSPVNPVDLTAQLTAGGTVVPALRVLTESGEVDAVVLVTSLSSAGRLERDAAALAELIARSGLPIFIFSYTRPAPSCVQILQDLGVPWYTSAARAARGLAALVSAGRAQQAELSRQSSAGIVHEPTQQGASQ